MKKDFLLSKLAAHFGDLGDVFTDAPECRASVAAAENLSRLAARLSNDTEPVCQGLVFLNHNALVAADVRLDGTLCFENAPKNPKKDDLWEISLPNGRHLKVAFFEGETVEDHRWVIDDNRFCDTLLSE